MQNKEINFNLAKDYYQRERSFGKVIQSARKFGVEFEMVPNTNLLNFSSDSLSATIKEKNLIKLHNLSDGIIPIAWGSGTDGSLSNRQWGVEIQTAPMIMKVGEDSIVKFCKEAIGLGWVTDNSCGLHVHIDANDIKDNPELVRRLFLLYFVMDYSILAMIPINRRTNPYCAPMDATKARTLVRSRSYYDKGFSIEKIVSSKPTKKDFLEMFYKKNYEQIPEELRAHYNEARYHGTNFHTLYTKYGTVEMRYLEGTLDSNTIINWIAFHQHIVDSARLIREVEAIELFHIKGVKTRLRRFAEITKMKEATLDWAYSRIDQFKDKPKPANNS